MENNDKTKVNIFGSCVSRDTFNYDNEQFEVQKFVSFISPISFVYAKAGEHEKEVAEAVDALDNTKVPNFRKRNIMLDYKKMTMDFLASQKCDFLIIDLCDARKQLFVLEDTVISDPIVIRDPLFSSIFGKYEVKSGYDYSEKEWEDCIREYCDMLLKHFKQEQIILLKARMTSHYIDADKSIRYFPQVYNGINLNKANELFKFIESRLIERMPNIHEIKMPENVLADTNHQWGLYPLHYCTLCYNYFYKAIQLISEKHDNECEKLNALYNFASLEAEQYRQKIKYDYEINKLISIVSCYIDKYPDPKGISYLLKREADPLIYLKMLLKFKEHITILIAVRDTPGEQISDEILSLLNNDLGFTLFTKSQGVMYCGCCYRGVNICNNVSESAGGMLTSEISLSDIKISLESKSFNKGNSSKIMIDGIDYAVNSRGVNIVVYDTSGKEVLDSAAFDHYKTIKPLIHKAL